MTPRTTTNGLEIMWHRYFEGRPEMIDGLEETAAEMEIGDNLYRLREAAGLTQSDVAKLAGTTQSAIARLEDADYEGHSLSMLRRVAKALGHRVEVRFVPAGPTGPLEKSMKDKFDAKPARKAAAKRGKTPQATVAKEKPAKYRRKPAAKKKK